MAHSKYLKGTTQPFSDLIKSIPLDPLFVSMKFFDEKGLNDFLLYNQKCNNYREFLINKDEKELIYGIQNPSMSAKDYLKRRNLYDFLGQIEKMSLNFSDTDLKIIQREGWGKSPSEINISIDPKLKEESFKLIKMDLKRSLQENSQKKLKDWLLEIPGCRG